MPMLYQPYKFRIGGMDGEVVSSARDMTPTEAEDWAVSYASLNGVSVILFRYPYFADDIVMIIEPFRGDPDPGSEGE